MRKATRGYIVTKTSSGKTRYCSTLIIKRRCHHIASHGSSEIAYSAHLRAKKLIESMGLDRVKEIIRMEAIIDMCLPGIGLNSKHTPNIFKRLGKYYFRFMIKGNTYCSHGFLDQADAYNALIDARLKVAKEIINE